MKITNTLRVATYMVAIFMVSLTACKKVDNFFFSKYHLQLDENTLNGKVEISTNDGKSWHPLTTKDTVVDDRTTITFRATPDKEYTFTGWLQTDVPFPNENPVTIKLNNNVKVYPNFIKKQSEYVITLGNFTLTPTTLTPGTIEYQMNNNGTWTAMTLQGTVTVKDKDSIQFRVTEPAGTYFWGWTGLEKYIADITSNITAWIKPVENFTFSAEFGDHKLQKIAIKPTVKPAGEGAIYWSSKEDGTYAPLKIGTAEYDSIFLQKTPKPIYIKVVATDITLYQLTTDGVSVTGGTLSNGASADIYKIDIDNTATVVDIVATLEKRKYTITLATITGGHIEYSLDDEATYSTTSPKEVEAGSTIYFKAILNSGYEFGVWTGDIADKYGTNTANPTPILTMKGGNITVNATLVQQAQVTINAPTTGQGTVSYTLNGTSGTNSLPTTISVPTGQTLVVTANSNNSASPYYRCDAFTTSGTGAPTLTTSFATNTATLATYTGKAGDVFTISANFIRQYKIDVPTLPTGASAFSITPSAKYATVSGSQPTTMSEVIASTMTQTIIFVDSNTAITAKATPAYTASTTTAPAQDNGTYYRFKNWDGTTFTGSWNGTSYVTATDGTNTSNAITPTSDLTIPAPTFQQQYKMEINSLTTATNNGYFNIGDNSTANAGGQPSPTYKLNSNSPSNLVGYFDASTNLTIKTNPVINYKIRFNYSTHTAEKLTSYTINQNTSLTGLVSVLEFKDLFTIGATLSARSQTYKSSGSNFSAYYASPTGMFDVFGAKNAGLLTFNINNNDGQLSDVKIENTVSGYSQVLSSTNPNQNNIVSPGHTSGTNLYTYTLYNLTVAGDTPIGSIITLTITLQGDGSGYMGVGTSIGGTSESIDFGYILATQ